MLRRLILSLALLCVALAAPGMAEAQTFPKLTGRVVDNANLLDPAQEQALEAKLAGIERDTGHQLVVATLPDLQGRDIADYGYRLLRAWGIGSKATNDGAILIVAPNERRVRIEVGYGLEGVLTDALSSLIIANAITPRFKAGDFPGGIEAGVDQIAPLLKLTPEEAKARAAAMAAQARKAQQEGEGLMAAVYVIGFILLFFVLPFLLNRARGGQRFGGTGGIGGIPPIILWGPGFGGRDDDDRWGGGGFGGWGGGGGGGFSGGGGSGGGGGASGGW